MDNNPDYYFLPSHPGFTCIDPLGIVDKENPLLWTVISTAIQKFRHEDQALSQLPRLIEDLSYSVHSTGLANTEFLETFLLDVQGDGVLDNVLSAALDLPKLFPSHSIPYLSLAHPSLTLSPQQIRCLLAHQTLNTLRNPRGNLWGCTFVSWYSSPQPLATAVSGYLDTLFQYFGIPLDPALTVTYEFTSVPINGDQVNFRDDERLFQHLQIEATTSDSTPFPYQGTKCVLVSSNQSPGFGSACTQEELVTAACPALLPLGALMVSPPVPADAAIVAHGHHYVSSWAGQGRIARLIGPLRKQTLMFMLVDASELDVYEGSTENGLADLQPSILARDVHKAFVGMSAVKKRGVNDVTSPLWGAGAFGGNPLVKILVLGVAAARTGVVVRVLVNDDISLSLDEKQANLLDVLTTSTEKSSTLTVKDILNILQTSRDLPTIVESLTTRPL